MTQTVQVSISVPNSDPFYYSVPRDLKTSLHIGKRVLVPLGNRLVIGFAVGFDQPPDDIKLKGVVDIIDETPIFDNKRLEFFKWVADYYYSSLGTVLKFAHPGGLGTSLQRFLVITEKGEKRLDSNSIGNKERELLSVVRNSSRIKVERLIEFVEEIKISYVNTLILKGLIDYDYDLKSVKPKFKKIVISKKTEDSRIQELKKKKPAKGRLLEFVNTHQKVSYEDLNDLFSNLSQHLRWLEENDLVNVEKQEVFRDPFKNISTSDEPIPKLTTEQGIALKKINQSIANREFSPFLLHGVTGSGKTEVYLNAIKKVIDVGKQAIVLVPEISLTPQLVKRFKSRFGDKVGVIHSLLNDGERFDAWRRAISGEVQIAIGARSAIFAPFNNLGIIVVDEEHETSYKQEESPCYNARDLALVLGQLTNSVVILGSATPSLESYANSLREKFSYLTLPLRVGENLLPDVEVVNMRREKKGIFSSQLKKAIVNNYKSKNQTILFLNRRGFSTVLIRENSGEIFNCPNCSIPFTYHRDDDSIKCHYCGTNESFKKISADFPIKGFGVGTQLVENEIRSILPNARIERMDRDSTGSKVKLLNLYKKLEEKQIDILIGTQMVAKGHDLPDVTLVGVISADMALGIPDFRSGERTFQLVTQVAGRAGRGDKPGRVVVQTHNPEHPAIKYAVKQDSIGFLNEELKVRKTLEYPPYSKIVSFRFSGSDFEKTAEFAKLAGKNAKSALSNVSIGSLEIIGPSECPIFKVKNKYRWQMIVKSSETGLLHSFSKKLNKYLLKRKGRINVSMDIDPFNFS